MDFFRNQIAKFKNRNNNNQGKGQNEIDEKYHGPVLNLPPGQVEEAVHYMSDSGFIDLSFLRFYSSPSISVPPPQQQYHVTNNYGTSSQVQEGGIIESFLDIAVFEVPEHCTSRNCDLSKYGVGMLTHFKDATYVSLCQAGRLMLDHNKFQGHHTQVMIPSEGSMPDHIKGGKFSVPQKRFYSVMLANCNQRGQHVHVTGQVVFDFEYDAGEALTVKSLATLMSVAFAVFVVLSMLAIRINCGTRSDFESERFGSHEPLPTTDDTTGDDENTDDDRQEQDVEDEENDRGTTTNNDPSRLTSLSSFEQATVV